MKTHKDDCCYILDEMPHVVADYKKILREFLSFATRVGPNRYSIHLDDEALAALLQICQ